MRLALVCFYCLCVFVYVLYFIATMSFAGYFLPVLFCMLSMLISDSRFDLVWFRLSCDHGWIRSGSVNVRKQQQHNIGVSNDLQKKSRLSQNPWLRTPRAPSTGASYTGALLAALSVGSSAGCTRRTVLALPWCRPGRQCSCSRQLGTDRSVL